MSIVMGANQSVIEYFAGVHNLRLEQWEGGKAFCERDVHAEALTMSNWNLARRSREEEYSERTVS